MSIAFLTMEKISKTYGGIDALVDMNLQIDQGEVLGLIGENGAGKSTLMKILCGIENADAGKILLDGQEKFFENPHDAQRNGVAMIPQELLLVQELTVVQNLFLGREIKKTKFVLDKTRMKNETEKILQRLHSSHISADAIVGTLPKSDQQILAIARRMLQGGRIFIMDEPTTALTENEVQILFSIIQELKANGCPIIYISHRFEECLEICDRFTILRDGKLVTDISNSPDVTKQTLIQHMVGSEIPDEYPHTPTTRGSEVLRVENLSYTTFQGEIIKDINFSLHESEIVGITGLAGVGKTELGQTLMGLRKISDGMFFIKDKPVIIKSPVEAALNNIGYVSEDRRDEGLVLGMSSQHNMTLSCLNAVSRANVISFKKEHDLVSQYLSKLSMKEEYRNMDADNLSGGNQQKIVILRQILSDAEIIIFDEPTKGIDIKAKAEVAQVMGQLSAQKKSVLLLSSEPREVLGISDVIYVLTRKGMKGPFKRGGIDYGQLMNIEFEGSAL